jgi:hypothetical protein
MWDAEVAWLEGTWINVVKGAEARRGITDSQRHFATVHKTEFGIGRRTLEAVQHDLVEGSPTTDQDGEHVLKSLASAGSILVSALRLWLAYLPVFNNGVPFVHTSFCTPIE